MNAGHVSLLSFVVRMSTLGVLATIAASVAPDSGKAASEQTLYRFCTRHDLPCSTGSRPLGGLVMDAAGNLYGTTSTGGAKILDGCATTPGGTVFRIRPDGLVTTIYNFCSQANCADGKAPSASLIMDAAGNLYGTTAEGGTGGGVVFELSPDQFKTEWTEKVLYTFCSEACLYGYSPRAGLLMDSAGNLYGTTELGGAHYLNELNDMVPGGTVFELTPNAGKTAWTYQVLYSFCATRLWCADGAEPEASLIMDSAGNLYGTTTTGGLHAGIQNNYVGGTVFELNS